MDLEISMVDLLTSYLLLLESGLGTLSTTWIIIVIRRVYDGGYTSFLSLDIDDRGRLIEDIDSVRSESIELSLLKLLSHLISSRSSSVCSAHYNRQRRIAEKNLAFKINGLNVRKQYTLRD